MHTSGSSRVKDKDGVWGTVVPGSPHLPSIAAQVVVQIENGQQILVPTDLLVQQPDGSYYLPRRLAERTYSGSEHGRHQNEPMVVPVLVEELEVQKRLSRQAKSGLSRWYTNVRPLLMNCCFTTKSPSRTGRSSAWWMVPCQCVRKMARRLFPSWKRCW